MFFKLYLVDISTKYLLITTKERYLTDKVKDIAVIVDLSLVTYKAIFLTKLRNIDAIIRYVVYSKLTDLILNVIEGNNITYSVRNPYTTILTGLLR